MKKKKKKIKSTSDEFIESLTSAELKKFNEGYREFALSELILALMERDEISVRKLAKIADISPTIVQAMRTGSKGDFTMQSFMKILKGLGCKKFIVEVNGHLIPLTMGSIKK